MKITIYRTTRTTKPTDGRIPKTFNVYFTKLSMKNGQIVTATVEPTEEIRSKIDRITSFPIIVEFQKENAKLDTRTGLNKNGDFINYYTLWLKKVDACEEFIITPLEDFE